MKREDIIREVQTMMPDGMDGYQVCKAIVMLSREPEGTFKKIGPSGGQCRHLRRPMSQAEAKRIVDAAVTRIELVDSTD